MTEPRKLNIKPMERVLRYKQFYGGLVFDKLWSLNIKETMLSSYIRPLSQRMVLAGQALTVKMHSYAEDEDIIRARGNRGWGGGPRQKEVMQAIIPGSVLCIDTGPNSLVAVWGEMSAHLAQSLGAVGAVVAGNVRDTRVLVQMKEFPVFSMGAVANAKAGWIVEKVNTPVYMPGHLKHSVKVFPGDFLFGDSDGVQVIPRDAVDEVMLLCEELLETETEERKKIKEGLSLDDVYRIYGNL